MRLLVAAATSTVLAVGAGAAANAPASAQPQAATLTTSNAATIARGEAAAIPASSRVATSTSGDSTALASGGAVNVAPGGVAISGSGSMVTSASGDSTALASGGAAKVASGGVMTSGAGGGVATTSGFGGGVVTSGVGGRVTSGVADVANPVRLRIPAIGVSTRVIPLRLDKKGGLVAPKQFDRVGWNKAGPEPGETGVAVIAGHVDSATGPAVFYRLRQLRKGDRVHVDRADGGTATFVVGRLARYPKNRIPNKEVYSSGKGTQLRLITCGGTFDRSRRSYRDNVIVFAS
ncbi:class F sortase [Nonomuraea jiangxiensis]|uniref:Sortase family protein n=1 Tax=Nonomuraea jiangxiensis TaxID=633440 RepID=A0A1G8SYQ8_9ACTN|nr:class F sortase [Nonomuraea jiangxiensis]SDJ33895.1 Sortase family protein [Nonomuraea jiangxiensis]